MSTSSRPAPLPPHPITHPDILPLIITFSTDATIARLMRVSRLFLSAIVDHLYPHITVNPGARRRPLRVRSDLPVNPHWFSTEFAHTLALYARTVRVAHHAPYLCPPRALVRRNGNGKGKVPEVRARARVLVVDRLGLCNATALQVATGGRTGQEAGGGHALGPGCAIGNIFSPHTIRIDDFYSTLPLPSGLRLGPSLRRLVLYGNANIVTTIKIRDDDTSGSASIFTSLPATVSEVALLLPREPVKDVQGLREVVKQVHAMASWLACYASGDEQVPGEAKRGIIVGADVLEEVLQETEEAKRDDGAMPEEDGEACFNLGEDFLSGVFAKALSASTSNPRSVKQRHREDKSSGSITPPSPRVDFISLERYLLSPEARIENTWDEMRGLWTVVALKEKIQRRKRQRLLGEEDGQGGDEDDRHLYPRQT